jgi:HSP20 family protein
MNLTSLKEGIGSVWDSVSDGWRRLRDSSASALTLFKPSERNDLPAADAVDDAHYLPSAGWAMLAGNVFEDEKNVIVWLEIPGMEKDHFDIEVRDDHLTVSGEKRFERERSDGRYRSFECAYGRFRRSIALPAGVDADQAKATYRNGILKIVMPKRTPARPKESRIRIN